MSLLQKAFSFLSETLKTTVTYRSVDGSTRQLDGVWASRDYDKNESIGVGAERTSQEAVFHVKQSEGIDQRGRIEYRGDVFQIRNFEYILDASVRLYLVKTEGVGGSPFRASGSL